MRTTGKKGYLFVEVKGWFMQIVQTYACLPLCMDLFIMRIN